jgi:D-beta-D-heptose 7-phosphate kinase/D-beta-D-heptose 1-phosphate adenosyltransferase
MREDLDLAALERKILSRADAVLRHGPTRTHRLVFTNGCFDLLHRGHVELLWWARRQGDALVLGLNSDDSVRRLKGRGRPLTPEGDRAFVLAALPVVDAVVIFEEDTPLELIRALQPDVIVKGGDYRPDEVVGRDVVQARGGKVAIFPAVAGRSTSALLERIRTTWKGTGERGGAGKPRRSDR